MNEWSVTVEAKAPHPGPDEPVIDCAAELSDLLADFGAAVAGDGRGWTVMLTVDAFDPTGAWQRACEAVTAAANKVTMPAWPIVHTEVMRCDVLEAELAKPTFPDVVGSGEVLQMLDISKQRLHELRTAGRFPLPMVELAATPVWLRSAIEGFVEQWDRRPGRPRTIAEAERAIGIVAPDVDGFRAVPDAKEA